jgi:glycosyltransferase involved in cell wall biosynthesis
VLDARRLTVTTYAPSTLSNPSLTGSCIVSFAVDRWDDVPRCRHHVMSRLARSNRVLFVSPQTHVRDVLRHPAADAGHVRRVSDNLFTYVPSRWVPYSDRPSLNRVFARLHVLDLRRVMRQLGMDRPILYIWHPFFADVIGHFDERAIVYHCYDEYAAFSGSDRARVAADELRVLHAADVVVAVSDGLHKLKSRENPNTHLVRNAADYDHFATAQHPATPIAPEVKDLPKPMIGCVTRVVPEYFDAELLREIFIRRPDWSLVVVGPECGGGERAEAALRALKALPNVRLLGRRDFRDLPSYLKAFDVCLIPYVLSENKQLADPLKLYEYLAAGKPVVSKPLALLADVEEVITLAEGADAWVVAIERALRTDSPGQIARRQEIARANTWDARVERISELIAQATEASVR